MMEVIWPRRCVCMILERVIYLSELGMGATSEAGKCIFMCTQYFVVASCG